MEAFAVEVKKNKALGARTEESEKQLHGSQMREQVTERARRSANGPHEGKTQPQDNA
jgi:hypothetical protein